MLSLVQGRRAFAGVGVRRYELIEEEVAAIPAAELAVEQALHLHAQYPKELEFGFPSPLNGQCYQLRSRGYVGVVPLGADAALEINPKIRCSLLMPMLEYAYQLPKISTHKAPATMGDIYEFWAEVLAHKVLQRVRRGLFWDYQTREGLSRWVRGRVYPERSGLGVHPYCRFAEHTLDILDNRILASALHGLRRFAFRRESIRQMVGRAWGALSELNYRSIRPADCLSVPYHRLNEDYRSMHALCYPLLQQRSPAWGLGAEEGPAYLLHMPSLFERFCTAFIDHKLKHQIELKAQYHTRLKGTKRLSFRLDMALFSAATGQPLAVIDAKYKADGPIESDVQQVVAYAVQLGTHRAFLLYPSSDMDEQFKVGPVAVQMLGFNFAADDLEEAGRAVICKVENVL